ncbi:MAG TPA: ABC transporter permease [Acidobacteriota bacterium]|nr:ABC transporter permease [Acidobacteriota bacterium]
MIDRRELRYRVKQLFEVPRETRLLLIEAAVALLLWESAGWILEFRPSILPTPSRILLEIWRQFPLLQTSGQTTFEEITLGLLLAVLLAAPIAYLLAVVPKAHRYAAPLLQAMHRAPLLALAPVLFLWFTLGLLPKVLMVSLMAFFPATAGILRGLRSIPDEMRELLRIMQAGSMQVAVKLHIPGSLPGFLDGLKSAITMGISGAVVAEFVAADEGLGYLILSGISKMDAPFVFASLTVLTAIGLAFYVAVTLLERILIPWHNESANRDGAPFGRHA